MTVLTVSGVSLNFGVDDLFSDITFSVEEGDRVGVVGVNGSGKSSLCRIIAGEYEPSRGSVFFARDKRVGFLEQDDAFRVAPWPDGAAVPEGYAKSSVLCQMFAAFPELLAAESRIAELEAALADKDADHASQSYIGMAAELASLHNFYAGNDGLVYRSRCRSMLEKLGFGPETHTLDVSSLSGGQRTRLALARLLSREPDILMLDEPTNHLDSDTMAWLEEHLRSYKKTVFVVSHDRYFLDRVTNRTLELEYGRARLWGGGYSRYVELKKADRDAQARRYREQQREIERLEAIIEQQKKWSHYVTAFAKQKQLDRIERVEAPRSDPRSIRFGFTGSGESGNDVLYLRDVGMAFDSHRLFSDLTTTVKKRERLFIAGRNGCGKSTLVRILLGRLAPTEGIVEFGYNVTVGYYDQENQNLSPDKTVLDELWDAYPKLTMTEVRSALALFLFRGDDIEKPVSVLSGGERARLTLCKLILSKMNLLILDEPTNHLDIGSREALEDALADFDGTVIAVSHDRYFASKLATRVIELDPAGVREYKDGYAEYLAAKEAERAEAAAAAADAPSDSRAAYLASKQEASSKRREEARRRRNAEETAALERELAAVDEELYGSAATDYVRAAELTERKAQIEDRLLELYAEE